MRTLQREAEKLLQGARAGRAHKQDRLDTVEQLRADLKRRAHRATKAVEGRTEELRSGLEKQLAKRLDGLLRRLDVPSRSEFEDLLRRLHKIEKALASRVGAGRHVTR